MVDYCMCPGDVCESRTKCFRYMAEPDPFWQSYFMKCPEIKDGKCDHFMPWEGKR